MSRSCLLLPFSLSFVSKPFCPRVFRVIVIPCSNNVLIILLYIAHMVLFMLPLLRISFDVLLLLHRPRCHSVRWRNCCWPLVFIAPTWWASWCFPYLAVVVLLPMRRQWCWMWGSASSGCAGKWQPANHTAKHTNTGQSCLLLILVLVLLTILPASVSSHLR